MGRFSEKMGITKPKLLQVEEADEELRNQLWSGIVTVVITGLAKSGYDPARIDAESMFRRIWVGQIKRPLDELSQHGFRACADMFRQDFFDGEWWRMYDLLQATIDEIRADKRDSFIELCNYVLQRENSAYRVVGGEIGPITDRNEMKAVDDAMNFELDEVREHVRKAATLLFDRQKPDHHNSIKESISAVEALCRRVTGNSKATLGDCLKKLKTAQPNMHPAFVDAFNKLYGYTSDEGGIRHSLTESDARPSFADAKFMLVACSAFVNYVEMVSAAE